MKKLIFALLVLISVSTQAQDTTKVKGLQLSARLIYMLQPAILKADNDSLFQVAIDLRPRMRIATPPTGTTLVTIDSIPTVELANLYNYSLNAPGYTKMATLMQPQIATARTNNSYLDALCLAFETFYDNKTKEQIQSGKKMATGKL